MSQIRTATLVRNVWCDYAARDQGAAVSTPVRLGPADPLMSGGFSRRLAKKRPLETAALGGDYITASNLSLLRLSTRAFLIASLIDHKGIVIAELRPRPVRDFLESTNANRSRRYRRARKIADCRETSSPAPLLRFGWGRSLPKKKLYCQ